MLINNVHAQDEDIIPKPRIQVLAKAFPDSIIIRWAPDGAAAWHYANQYGYKIEKQLIIKNGKLLDDPEIIPISEDNFRPVSLEEWEKLAFPNGYEGKPNEYAGVAAQAIYGETFEFTDQQSTAGSIINQVREQEMRFSYALMACDYDLNVARAAGLCFIDKEVYQGEKYFYKIYALVPENVEDIDTGYFAIGIDDFFELPQPLEFNVSFGDKSVVLSWNNLYHRNIYNGYYIERSEDGGNNFIRISERPFSNPFSERIDFNKRFAYQVDSLPSNDVDYIYRVRGVTPFGEIGPPSEEISGKGFKELIDLPNLFPPQFSKETGDVILNWTFPKESLPQIEGFIVEKSSQADGVYKPLHEDLLPSNVFEYRTTQKTGATYYRVRARDKYNQESKCLPHLVQIPDSIPPMAPAKLKGEMDTLGVVYLQWDLPPDEDVAGFRVYRSNFKEAEYYQVTISPTTLNAFIDTVSMKTLTEEVYYKVAAEDNYFNLSELSEACLIERPDIIPPTSPIFKKVKSTDKGIEMTWIPSSSEDVAQHVLFRAMAGKEEWEVISSFQPNDDLTWDTNYKDESLETGIDYQYVLIAVDSSNLESPPSPPIVGRKIDRKIKPAVEKIKTETIRTEKMIRLTWKYELPNVERYHIYRAENDAPLRLYDNVEGNLQAFEDRKLKQQSVYTYRLQAIFMDGSTSAFSEEITVIY